MHRALLALPLLALTFTAACDAEDSSSDFRAIPMLQGQNLDIGIQLTSENGDGDGTVIWDIKEVGVYEGEAADDSDPLLTIDADGSIYDAEGKQTCALVAPYLGKKLFHVTGTQTDEVLYSTYKNMLFRGKVVPEDLTHLSVLRPRLLFTFSDNEVYFGSSLDGNLLLSATEDLTVKGDNVQLLIAALIEGECGSNGLPGYTPSP
ncbi:hypothetical protein ACNOYE_32970 [Nannocystaceae bacterium ST9]